MPDFTPDFMTTQEMRDRLNDLQAKLETMQTTYGPRATKAWVRYGTLIGGGAAGWLFSVMALWYGGWPRVFLSGLCTACLTVGLISAVAPAIIPQGAPFRKPDGGV